MTGLSRRRTALFGFGWGALAGLVLVALMYGADVLLGLRPLPQLLNEPVLSLMPGFVFGFLIDTLQHAGKVVEEVGLIVAMLGGLAVLGSAWALASARWHTQYLALGFAGIGWVVVSAILLPLCGAGFLGLNDGPATPIIWAALFAIYGVVLQLGGDPAGAAAADAGRRRLLSTLPIAIGAISLGALAWRLLPDWYRAIVNPAEAGLHGLSPELTPVANFYVVSKNNIGADPTVDERGWKLTVGGSVQKPLRLSLSDLRALNGATEHVTMECISNNVGGEQMSTGSFTGVRLGELLAMANPKPEGTWVAFKARDGYTESISMSLVQSAPEILVAYDLDGAPLPMKHGFPARMIIPGHYGMKGPKWLDSIDLVDRESQGFWEQQGWDHNAVVKTTSRIDVPGTGDLVKLGAITVGGVAFAGSRGISKVEVSTDGGSTWRSTPFKAPLSPLTWVLWTFDWTPAREGAYRLMVRATDGKGALQDSRGAPSYPSGSSGYHTIQVDISK
jgi:DMSO/TMAO reductase YedYZ molybdopterin-dependent catalytic subunit